ncbi:outer membrane protein [Chelativorans xinjiangense]|uniref:outer membrane protein n=1 Tax=Chelativorans xinjiangense TaxID=2681485 RepID=UPI00135B9E35|nr:outer membrane protein [Chelativorans xinjiangense]
MLKTMKPVVAAAAFAFATGAYAADIYEPPVVEMPPPPFVEKEVAAGGWYLRGDINYHWSKLRGTEYITYGPPPGTDDFDNTDLDGAMSLGAGVGYQMTRYLRTDFTADYWFKSDFRGTTSGECGDPPVPCTSTDKSAYSALLLMANAYVDLGTYRGVTPYVGAGIGGAYVKWDDLENTIDGDTDVHRGAKNWRFAWSLMAGASYCLTENLQLDAGYRFSRIEGGRMFEESGFGVGPGYDDGFNVHEARAGLRYSFGGGNPNCVVPQMVAYDPPPYEPPVYK